MKKNNIMLVVLMLTSGFNLYGGYLMSINNNDKAVNSDPQGVRGMQYSSQNSSLSASQTPPPSSGSIQQYSSLQSGLNETLYQNPLFSSTSQGPESSQGGSNTGLSSNTLLMNAVIAYGQAQLDNASTLVFGNERLLAEKQISTNPTPSNVDDGYQYIPKPSSSTELQTAQSNFTTTLTAQVLTINTPVGDANMTPLMMAVRYHSIEMVNALLNAGAQTGIESDAVNMYLNKYNRFSSTQDLYAALSNSLNNAPQILPLVMKKTLIDLSVPSVYPNIRPQLPIKTRITDRTTELAPPKSPRS